MMKLWVDDIRPAPEGWCWAKNVQQAYWHFLDVYTTCSGPVTELSLDHDLGGDETTRELVLWLCEKPELWPATIYVHTANPVGREWLEGMIDRYGPGVTR